MISQFPKPLPGNNDSARARQGVALPLQNGDALSGKLTLSLNGRGCPQSRPADKTRVHSSGCGETHSGNQVS